VLFCFAIRENWGDKPSYGVMDSREILSILNSVV
jgi:hypothetical protein